MADLKLQPSIETDKRAQAHLALMNRLKELDLSPILVYRVASLVDSAVLPLAWQWDVLNPLLLPEVSQVIAQTYPNWDQIANLDALSNVDILQFGAGVIEIISPLTLPQLMAAYRALILLSTSLHSIMGSVGALKQGLSALGFPTAVLQEGQNSWGGTTWPDNEGWAVFRVLVDLASVPASTDFTTLQNRMYAICNFWKPARSWLDSVQFQWRLSDTLIPPITDFLVSAFLQRDVLVPIPMDVITGLFGPIADQLTTLPYWNAQYYHTGITYGQNEPDVPDGPLVVNGNAIAH
jgi:hypothetical protein